MIDKNGVVRWALLARWSVAVNAAYVLAVLVPDAWGDVGGIVGIAGGVAVFWLLKLKAGREQERQNEAAALLAGVRQ